MTNWPQYAILAFGILGVGMALAKHGEPKDGTHSFWATLISLGIEIWLLYMGGFFAALI